MKVELFGGPFDGRVIHVPVNAYILRLPLPPPLPADSSNDSCEPFGFSKLGVVSYRMRPGSNGFRYDFIKEGYK